jgi:hypothetical protein
MKPEEAAAVNTAPVYRHQRIVHPAMPLGQSEERSIHRVKTDPVNPPRLNHIQFNKLEASNTAYQNIARDIRKVNQSMQTIDANLHQMQAALETIVKIYPPYPPGASERIDALRQVSTLRKMIDQIAHPAQINGLENILGNPTLNPRAGDWTVDVGKPAAESVIRHQPVHTGPDGLDIPVIDDRSSDRQLVSAIDKISSAIGILKSRHQTFIAEANRVISQIY